MDYPFRNMVIGFLMGYKNAYQAAEDIETLRENYPREALSCALNLLSSHDRPRIISVLAAAPTSRSCPRASVANGAWTKTPWAWPRAAFGWRRSCR